MRTNRKRAAPGKRHVRRFHILENPLLKRLCRSTDTGDYVVNDDARQSGAAVFGLMQDQPINLVSILQHAGRWHGEQEIVTQRVEGGIHRQSYAETLRRATALAASLLDWGLRPGDRIGTMGWNTHRHLECWYAVSGQGAICHTINPRLFVEQLNYIVNHAEDRMIFVDLSFVAALTERLQQMPTVEALVVMTDRAHMPVCDTGAVELLCYEDWVTGTDNDNKTEASMEWPTLDDNTASSLCYTSGTTGDPKGVLYTHRANLLHAYASCLPDVFDLSAKDTVLMIVPMFHANSWGLAYAAPMVGAKLVLPGADMSGASIHGLIAGEAVTKAAGVPTVWNTLLAYLDETGLGLDSLREVVVGGTALPASMISAFRDRYEVETVHAWGMTEMTPIGVFNRPKPGFDALAEDAQLAQRLKQGRVPFGVDMRIVDDRDKDLPRDGEAFGRLLVKGPWTIDRYYGDDASALADGWFDTGDIATIDSEGYMQITDRAKDVVKSGGEWISSVAVENAAIGVPGVALAACIGAAHPKWGERPLLLVQCRDGQTVAEDELRKALSESLARWQLPDAVVFVEQIPLTATGKIDKKPLRERYRSYLTRSC